MVEVTEKGPLMMNYHWDNMTLYEAVEALGKDGSPAADQLRRWLMKSIGFDKMQEAIPRIVGTVRREVDRGQFEELPSLR